MSSEFLQCITVSQIASILDSDNYYIKSICPSGGHGPMAAGTVSRYKTGLRLDINR